MSDTKVEVKSYSIALKCIKLEDGKYRPSYTIYTHCPYKYIAATTIMIEVDSEKEAWEVAKKEVIEILPPNVKISIIKIKARVFKTKRSASGLNLYEDNTKPQKQNNSDIYKALRLNGSIGATRPWNNS